jgi:hypothetical protein
MAKNARELMPVWARIGRARKAGLPADKADLDRMAAYDGMPKAKDYPRAKKYIDGLFVQKGGSAPGDIADEAATRGIITDGVTGALYDKMRAELDALEAGGSGDAAMDDYERAQQEDENFYVDVLTPDPDKTPVPVETLEPGDLLTVEDEVLEVMSVGDDGVVTLKDGKQYGYQSVRVGQELYVDLVDEAAETPRDQGSRIEDRGMGAAEPAPRLSRKEWIKAHRDDFVHVNLKPGSLGIDPDRPFKGWVLPIGGSDWPNVMSTSYGRAGRVAVLVPKEWVQRSKTRPAKIKEGFTPRVDQMAVIPPEAIMPDMTTDWSIVFQQDRGMGAARPVTPEMDAAYLRAVEAGDLATAQRMVDDAARAAGFNKKLFHSRLNSFDRFKPYGSFMGASGVSGIHLTDSKEMALRYLDRYADWGWIDGKPNQKFSKEVIEVYAKIENPLERDEPFKTNIGFGFPLPDGYVSPVERMGYDALIRNDSISRGGPVKHSQAKNGIRGKEFILTDPTRIKSADPVTRDASGAIIPLSRRFNSDSDSILYASRPGFDARLAELERRAAGTGPALSAEEVTELESRRDEAGMLAFGLDDEPLSAADLETARKREAREAMDARQSQRLRGTDAGEQTDIFTGGTAVGRPVGGGAAAGGGLAG